MKRFLICITTLVVTFMYTSCSCGFPMKGDTFTVIKEEKYATDSLSLYELRYEDDRMDGMGETISEFYVIMNKDAFEVGDKVKLVKVED